MSTPGRGSPDAAIPRTPPPRSPSLESEPPSGHRYHSIATPPALSPPASPSFSLHSLGVYPFSPLRRQFSSPLARPSPRVDGSDSEEDDLAQDSKDVLIQRLNDLASNLTRSHHVDEVEVDALHAKVDELEQMLHGLHEPRRASAGKSLSRPESRRDEATNGMSETPSSPAVGTSRSPDLQPDDQEHEATDLLKDIPEPDPNLPGLVHDEDSRIAQEAQKLYETLAEVAASLRARQEESDHLHGLLIMRAERAAQRIIELEAQVQEFEMEQSQFDAEILNLQIQLKAIEVHSLKYMPEDADAELLEILETYRAEWAALKRRRARRRGIQRSHSSGFPTPMRVTRNSTSESNV